MPIESGSPVDCVAEDVIPVAAQTQNLLRPLATLTPHNNLHTYIHTYVYKQKHHKVVVACQHTNTQLKFKQTLKYLSYLCLAHCAGAGPARVTGGGTRVATGLPQEETGLPAHGLFGHAGPLVAGPATPVSTGKVSPASPATGNSVQEARHMALLHTGRHKHTHSVCVFVCVGGCGCVGVLAHALCPPSHIFLVSSVQGGHWSSL